MIYINVPIRILNFLFIALVQSLDYSERSGKSAEAEFYERDVAQDTETKPESPFGGMKGVNYITNLAMKLIIPPRATTQSNNNAFSSAILIPTNSIVIYDYYEDTDYKPLELITIDSLDSPAGSVSKSTTYVPTGNPDFWKEPTQPPTTQRHAKTETMIVYFYPTSQTTTHRPETTRTREHTKSETRIVYIYDAAPTAASTVTTTPTTATTQASTTVSTTSTTKPTVTTGVSTSSTSRVSTPAGLTQSLSISAGSLGTSESTTSKSSNYTTTSESTSTKHKRKHSKKKKTTHHPKQDETTVSTEPCVKCCPRKKKKRKKKKKKPDQMQMLQNLITQDVSEVSEDAPQTQSSEILQAPFLLPERNMPSYYLPQPGFGVPPPQISIHQHSVSAVGTPVSVSTDLSSQKSNLKPQYPIPLTYPYYPYYNPGMISFSNPNANGSNASDSYSKVPFTYTNYPVPQYPPIQFGYQPSTFNQDTALQYSTRPTTTIKNTIPTNTILPSSPYYYSPGPIPYNPYLFQSPNAIQPTPTHVTETSTNCHNQPQVCERVTVYYVPVVVNGKKKKGCNCKCPFASCFPLNFHRRCSTKQDNCNKKSENQFIKDIKRIFSPKECKKYCGHFSLNTAENRQTTNCETTSDIHDSWNIFNSSTQNQIHTTQAHQIIQTPENHKNPSLPSTTKHPEFDRGTHSTSTHNQKHHKIHETSKTTHSEHDENYYDEYESDVNSEYEKHESHSKATHHTSSKHQEYTKTHKTSTPERRSSRTHLSEDDEYDYEEEYVSELTSYSTTPKLIRKETTKTSQLLPTSMETSHLKNDFTITTASPPRTSEVYMTELMVLEDYDYPEGAFQYLAMPSNALKSRHRLPKHFIKNPNNMFMSSKKRFPYKSMRSNRMFHGRHPYEKSNYKQGSHLLNAGHLLNYQSHSSRINQQAQILKTIHNREYHTHNPTVYRHPKFKYIGRTERLNVLKQNENKKTNADKKENQNYLFVKKVGNKNEAKKKKWHKTSKKGGHGGRFSFLNLLKKKPPEHHSSRITTTKVSKIMKTKGKLKSTRLPRSARNKKRHGRKHKIKLK